MPNPKRKYPSNMPEGGEVIDHPIVGEPASGGESAPTTDTPNPIEQPKSSVSPSSKY